MSKRDVFLALIALLAAIGIHPPVHAQEVFTVRNTNDSGDDSLRWAIIQANTHPGTDMIDFEIPGGGVHTIALISALPPIIDPVVIDGLSQTGASCTSWPPTLLIELDGSSAGAGANGLSVAADGAQSIISGLIINRFAASGIHLDATDHITVICNYIGTDYTGAADLGNYHGIYILDSADNTIGGTTEGTRNLISANGIIGTVPGSGVRIEGNAAAGNLIQGNYIGLQADGVEQLGKEPKKKEEAD